MNRAQLLSAIVAETGLDRATVRDLLKKGWTFTKSKEASLFMAPPKKGS